MFRLRELGNRLADRAGFTRYGSASDSSWVSEARVVATHGLLESFRRAHRLPASLHHTAQALRALPASDSKQLAIRANDLAAGSFSILGFERLSFGTPIDWHLEPVSNKRTPLAHWSQIRYLDPSVAGDKKITWELNRHQCLVTLGRAYAMLDDERYAQTVVNDLTSWMDANPPSRGINWASSLEVAFRAISWIWALELIKRSPAMTPEFLRRALWFLHAHGTHVERYLSTYFSPNTHLTGEALGLFYIGSCLPELRAAVRWKQLGAKILIDQLPRQVRPDGTYFEQSTWYHRYTTDFYLHFIALADRVGLDLPDTVGATTRKLALHLAALTRPDGTFPLLGDDDGGRFLALDEAPLTDWRSTISTAAVLFADPELKTIAQQLAPETIWLLGPDAEARWAAMEPRPPSFTSIGFPDGGFFVSRTDWSPKADWLVADAGPHGALSCGHGHADALSFELAVEGRTVLVDSGTFTYTGSQATRDAFRSTRAHNTALVDGLPSSEPGGPFSWQTKAQTRRLAWHTGHAIDYLEAEHDGYTRLSNPVVHRRAFAMVKGRYTVIRDSFIGSGPHRYDVLFHFAPGCWLREEADRFVLLAEDELLPLLRATFLGADVRTSRAVADVSPIYGAKEETDVLVASFQASGTCQLVTILARKPFHSVEIVASTVAGHAMQIQDSGCLDLLGWGSWSLSDAKIRVDADFAWLGFDESGVLASASFVGLRTFAAGTVNGRASGQSVELLSDVTGQTFVPPPSEVDISGFTGPIVGLGGRLADSR